MGVDAKAACPAQVSEQEVRDLPRLFEEFSRTTAELVATHDALRAQVDALKGELAAKNRRLEHKKRLEALGRVAAGVAHEFRNPLGGIRLTVDALIRDEPTQKGLDRLEHIRHALDHLNRIVEDLLSFTRNDGLSRSRTAIADLVDSAIALAGIEVPRNGAPGDGAAGDAAASGALVRGGPPDLHISVDRHAFTQVLTNLITNARQAAASRNDSRVGVWWGTRGDRVWIEVGDGGDGVPAGEEEQIFHPFHSLREGGTGLGLSIANSRLEAHEAEIAVVHDPWGGGEGWPGARFRILLPRKDEMTANGAGGDA